MSDISDNERTPDILSKSVIKEDATFKRPPIRRSLKRQCRRGDAENDENFIGVKKRKRKKTSNSTDKDVFRPTIVEKPFADSPLVTPEKMTLKTNVLNTEIQEKDPLAVTPLKILKQNFDKNCTIGDKLILTPVKARQFSISSEVEYDRVMESIRENQTELDYPIDGIKFIDNRDVIDEILEKKEITDLLNDNQNCEKDTDTEVKCSDLESKTPESTINKRRNSRKIKTPKQANSTKIKTTKQRRSREIKKPKQTSTGKMKTKRRPLRKMKTLERKSIFADYDISSEEDEEILDKILHEPLPEDVLEKFRDTIVKLEHEVPPQHKIEKGTLRSCLSIDGKAKFKTYGPLKEGRFSSQEDEIIRRNWKSFCELHELDIPQEKFFKGSYNGKYFIALASERRKFYQFLANGLPWRTLRSVYMRFRALYGYKTEPRNNKRYTEEEDAKIMKYMKSSELPVKKSKILTELLDRSYVSITRRYVQLLKKKKKKEKDETKPKKDPVWTLSLMEDFLKHLMDITISEDITDLKDSLIPKCVWLKLEDALDIDHEQLKNFWTTKLHIQLFAPRRIYYNEIKIMLLEYLYGKGIASADEVDWSEIVRCFDGYTPQFLIRMCPRPRHRARFGDLVETMYHEIIPILKEKPYDNCLPRLRYSNGKLEVIDILPDDSEIDD